MIMKNDTLKYRTYLPSYVYVMLGDVLSVRKMSSPYHLPVTQQSPTKIAATHKNHMEFRQVPPIHAIIFG